MATMCPEDPHPPSHTDETPHLLYVAETAIAAKSLSDFSGAILPVLSRLTLASGAILHIPHQKEMGSQFFFHGKLYAPELGVKAQCDELLRRFSAFPTGPIPRLPHSTLFPLFGADTFLALLGLTHPKPEAIRLPVLWQRLLRLLALGLERLLDRLEADRRLSHLNTYVSVSSMLAQTLDLHEILEGALTCCMGEVSAEAASVLLLDDEKKNFTFYQVGGPARTLLQAATFPADKGIAGHVLGTRRSEVIHDVQNDPRFYRKIDSDSQFRTRNMIAVPLLARDEKVGVLEVINKEGAASFTETDHRTMQLIAEEIAFAIRNAKVFQYVVNTYCKQRQGKASCKGCKRPLGSWTPCVKYREALL
jgi:hypothetical protein